MLSAMAASIGPWGTRTRPSEARASVMLWPTVKAVMVQSSVRPTAHQEHQAQDEEQVVPAR